MSGKRYRTIRNTFSDIDDSWEEEIERLKHNIKRTERKIAISEKSSLPEKVRLHKGHEDSDCYDNGLDGFEKITKTDG